MNKMNDINISITSQIKKILNNYGHISLGCRLNLARILMHGSLAGSGYLVILPIDQGFEHGPDKSFMMNDAAYDPSYLFQLAQHNALSAIAAPLGLLESGLAEFNYLIPTILKLNSNNSLMNTEPNQAFTSSVSDALAIGACGVGVTIYPGSDNFHVMIEEAKEVIKEARSCGLATVVWSYPRGQSLAKEHETALDICAYAAHIAALLGADIIKVKPPQSIIANPEVAEFFKDHNFNNLSTRVRHIVQSCFGGKRIVIFSGGGAKSDAEIFAEIKAIKQGGGFGSIIGRNSFQRNKEKANDLLQSIIKIYKGIN